MWKYVKWLTKIALILVLSWICKKEVVDLKNTKISKNHHVKRISFQIHSNKLYSKNDKILKVIKFIQKADFPFQDLLKMIGDSIGESNHMDGI